MSNNCETCSDATLVNQVFRGVVEEDPTFKWYQWGEENGFLQKAVRHGSTTDAFDELASQLPKFLWISFIKEKQATSYNSKSTAMESDSNRCLLRMDLAENFTCTWQDGIQSAHWKQRQVTVYTAMGEREMFYLTTHSTHFIYGYMASDIWLRTILIVRKETRCRHIGYSYRLTARVILYAPFHRQDNTYHGICYTSRAALAGTRNSSMGPNHEGSIRRPIAP